MLNHENRLWQQLTWQKKYGAMTLQTRFRAEESWRPTYEGCSVRVRNQFRVTRDIGRSAYYVAVSEEPFYNLNDCEGGPLKGFAQNRLFIGVGRKINWFTRFEVGYLNQYRNSRSKSPDLMNHVLVASLSFDLTAHKPKKQQEFKLAHDDHSSLVAMTPQLVMSDLYSPMSMYFSSSHGAAVVSPYHPALAALANHKHI